MYRKNTAGQFVCFQMLLTATGAIATGLSPAVRRCIDGTFAAGTGTVTEDTGTGSYKYAMSQADTNGNDISFIFSAATAMPVCVNIVTTAADPTDGVRLGLTGLANAVPGAAGGLFIAGTNAATTVTTSFTTTFTGNLTGSVNSVATAITLPSIPANWITAAGINASALNGKGDWLLASSYVAPSNLTAAQIATGVWQDATGTDFTTAGSIGKSLFTSGNVPGAASGLALVGSNMGSVSSITGVTFPTNFSALGIGATGHITNVDTLTTYTGNTPQTGDAFARIGLAGVGLTNLGDARIASLDATISSRMATYVQPTGFLTATFPAGTIANTTNITAGTITTVTNLTNAPTVGDLTGTMKTSVENAVWDAAMASHINVGSTGAKLNAASAAGDPWNTTIPGVYGPGTAGHRLGNIPDITAGSAGGVFIAGSNAATSANITGNITGNLSGSVGSVTNGVTLTSGERTSVADALLDRDMGLGVDTGADATLGRTVRQALRFLRNKWYIIGTTLSVTKEDDSTVSWTSTLTATPGADPITGANPTGGA